MQSRRDFLAQFGFPIGHSPRRTSNPVSSTHLEDAVDGLFSKVYSRRNFFPEAFALGTVLSAAVACGRDDITNPPNLPTVELKLTLPEGYDIEYVRYDVTGSAKDGYMKRIGVRTNSGYVRMFDNPSQSVTQTVFDIIPMPPSRGSMRELVVNAEATDGFGNASTGSKNIQLPTYITINPRSFYGEGLEGLATEPLITTKGTLVLEKDGRTERIDLEEARTLRLMPGEYKVRYEHQDYSPYALLRDPSYDTPLSQSDDNKPWMTLNVGLEDIVLDLDVIPRSFNLVDYNLIFDSRNEPGTTYWKPGLPLTLYIDTRAEEGGSGEKPSQEWIDNIKKAAESLKKIVRVGGKRPFENINVYVTDNPPPRGVVDGTVVAYAKNDSRFDGGNATVHDGEGYVTKGAFYLNTWERGVNSAEHELFQLIADATSSTTPLLTNKKTVYNRNSPSRPTEDDLKGNKLAASFKPYTSLKAA